MRVSCLVFLLILARAAAMDFHVIPFDVDPVIRIDAELDDWAAVPNAVTMTDPANATWGTDDYTGIDDLNGTIQLAWRPAGLFFAAVVVDDVFIQPYTGNAIYNGDHANLFIDLAPQDEPERNALGNGQYHLVVSPGNLAEPGSGEILTDPEVYFYVPEGMPHGGQCEVAARRTQTGYIVEAFLPFSLLGGFKAQQGKDVNFTVALSDADAMPARQQTFVTPTTVAWQYGRGMMIPMVLGDGNGRGQSPVRSMPVLAAAEILPQQAHTVSFQVPMSSYEKTPYLFFRGRINADRVRGWLPNALRLELNGQAIAGKRISNRPQTATMMRGDTDIYITDDGRIVLWYAPTFEAVDKHPEYRLVDDVKACEFEFDLRGLVQDGDNRLTIYNDAGGQEKDEFVVALADVELRLKTAAPSIASAAAPTGPLPVYVPDEPGRVWSALEAADRSVGLTVDNETFAVTSRFSMPNGKWAGPGDNVFFRHTRRVLERDEWIEVHDTFTNLTDDKLPIIQEHSCAIGEDFAGIWLSCVEMPSGKGRRSDPGNPSVFASTQRAGIGMLALNDEMKVHHESRADKNSIVLADRMLALPPGATYTAEWAIVPTARTTLWSFVNKARRMLDVNFTIDTAFAFMMGNEPVVNWTDARFQSFIDFKSANFIVQSIYGPPESRYLGRNAYSTAFTEIDHTYYRGFNKRLHRAFPDRRVRHGIYYHCFIDNYEGNDERFAAARVLDSAGNHVNYGGRHTYDQIFLPTADNDYGRETAKNIGIILDDIGADGIFWDEFCFSRVPFSYGHWDNCSADIDPKTFKVDRLKGSLALLSKEWRKTQVTRIQAHGTLVCSGAPHTGALAATRYTAFCETGSITYCRGMLLWTPLGLGDHVTERTQRDAFRQMRRQLDHGCLYAWYATRIIPTRKTLTEHMFPFTPVSLNAGVLIGDERILTNRSGLLGWGDNSHFDARVYDADGRATTAIGVPRLVRDGKAYAEVRIPEGYAAAIVRRPQ